jgi:hypothetical protein
LEHQNDSVKECTVSKKEDTVELPQRSQAYSNGNMEHKGCSDGNVEQQHNERRYSDGSTFFLNRLSGIRPEMRTEQDSGVTLPELLHPIGSLLRVFVATFTSDVSWCALSLLYFFSLVMMWDTVAFFIEMLIIIWFFTSQVPGIL